MQQRYSPLQHCHDEEDIYSYGHLSEIPWQARSFAGGATTCCWGCKLNLKGCCPARSLLEIMTTGATSLQCCIGRSETLGGACLRRGRAGVSVKHGGDV